MNSSLCVIGTDERMKYVYRYLLQNGRCVFMDDEVTDKCWDYRRMIIVLPPKKSLFNIEGRINIRNVKKVFGGAISKEEAAKYKNIDIDCCDYLKDETVVSQNAILTAKGIIDEARELNLCTDYGKCTVIGYGYCGKALANELQKQGFEVRVAVRRKELRTQIEKAGYEYASTDNLQVIRDSKYIFNTVPALLLDSYVIDEISSNIVIFDIASKPGGTDFAYCREKGITAVHSLGIPGRYYPREAGYIIAEYILKHIGE